MADPNAILYLSSKTARILVRSKGGWHEGVAPEGALWHLVTNLIDEQFVRVDIPPLGSVDRKSFLEAQLVGQLAGSAYRTILSYPSAGDQKRCVLTGVGGGQVDRAIQDLEKVDAKIVGLWSLPTLLMNELIRSRRSLPPTFLTMLPTTEGMRLVFVSGWQPTLTRLLPPGISTERLSEEISLTRRYLEDGKSIEPDFALPLLFMGGDYAGAEDLNSQGFKVLHSPWKSAADSDPTDLLLNAMLHKPEGQLAPLELRKAYVATKLKKAIIGVTAALVGMGFILGGSLAQATANKFKQIGLTQLAIDQLRSQSADLTSSLERSRSFEATGLAAASLLQGELVPQDSVLPALNGLSIALQGHPSILLSALDWRYVESGLACSAEKPGLVETSSAQQSMSAAFDASGADAGAVPAGDPSGAAAPRVLELTAVFRVPELDSPLLAGRQQQALRESLEKRGGFRPQLQSGAAKPDAALTGGGTQAAGAKSSDESGADLSYCLTMANQGSGHP